MTDLLAAVSVRLKAAATQQDVDAYKGSMGELRSLDKSLQIKKLKMEDLQDNMYGQPIVWPYIEHIEELTNQIRKFPCEASIGEYGFQLHFFDKRVSDYDVITADVSSRLLEISDHFNMVTYRFDPKHCSLEEIIY